MSLEDLGLHPRHRITGRDFRRTDAASAPMVTVLFDKDIGNVFAPAVLLNDRHAGRLNVKATAEPSTPIQAKTDGLRKLGEAEPKNFREIK